MEEIDVSNLKKIILNLKESETNEEVFWGRNDNFKLYKTIFEDDTISNFKKNVLDMILFVLDKRSINKYDLECSFDDTVEIMDADKVVNYQNVKNKIGKEEILPIDKNTNLEKLNFIFFKMILKLKEGNKTITVIKKFNKPSSVLKQSIKCIWLGDKMQQVKEDVIYLDNQVDAFEIDNVLYIFNRNHFNSIFKFKDMYCRLIDNSAKLIEDSDFIDNSSEFIEKCKSNGHYVKKISKAIIAKGFENIKQHKDKIPNIIREYNLNINLDSNGKIIYEEEKVGKILDLILDHCVKSALTDKKAIARALEFEEE